MREIDPGHKYELDTLDGLGPHLLNHLREALRLLEYRAAFRHGRSMSLLQGKFIELIECLITCKQCGHVGCKGECHAGR